LFQDDNLIVALEARGQQRSNPFANLHFFPKRAFAWDCTAESSRETARRFLREAGTILSSLPVSFPGLLSLAPETTDSRVGLLSEFGVVWEGGAGCFVCVCCARACMTGQAEIITIHTYLINLSPSSHRWSATSSTPAKAPSLVFAGVLPGTLWNRGVVACPFEGDKLARIPGAQLFHGAAVNRLSSRNTCRKP
jgi:hypothetical protein